MEPIYYSKFEIMLGYSDRPRWKIVCNIPYQELSLQEFDQKGNVTESYAHQLTKQEVKALYPYIDTADFEPYRDVESDGREGWYGYVDEYPMIFTGITDNVIPLIRLQMNALYKEGHNRPQWRLYDYLSTEFLSKKKDRKFWKRIETEAR